MHEDYHTTDPNLQNDIALIKMDEIIPLFNGDPSISNASPVCLPWSTKDKVARILKHGTKLTVTGWGKTERSLDSDILQQVDVPFQDEEVCVNEFKQFGLNLDPATQICAGGEEGKDSCNGDSGGPLAIRAKADTGYIQVGIVSFGHSQCGNGMPAVYTRVEAYLEWINKNMV